MGVSYGVMEKYTGVADGQWDLPLARQWLECQVKLHPMGDWQIFEIPEGGEVENDTDNWGIIDAAELNARIAVAREALGLED